MSDMIERIAARFREYDVSGTVSRVLAQAAIKEMRDPTMAMQEAGLVAGVEQVHDFAEGLRAEGETKSWAATIVAAGDGRMYVAAWQAMIDEALK